MPSKNRSVSRYNAPCSLACRTRRKREHSMGVRVTETNPEIRIAAQMVTANSLKSRPRMPPMNSTGMKFNGGVFTQPDWTVISSRRLLRKAAETAIEIIRKHKLEPWLYTAEEWYIP